MKDNYDERIRHLEAEIDRLKRGRLEYQRPVTLESLTHTMPAGMWTTYTPSSQTGWTALPTGTYRYTAIGKLVILRINMTAGTSNATTASIALPFTSANVGGSVGGANTYAIDNGTELTTMSRWKIGPNSTMIDFYKDAAVGAWTASGTKRIYCVAIYERA